MNEWFSEQYAAACKTNLETFYGFANLAVDGFQKLIELNLQTTKATLAETQALLSNADPQDVIAQQSNHSVELAKRIGTYNKRLYDIALVTQTGLASIATARYEAHNRRMQALADDLAKQVPVGSEVTIVALKKVIDSSNALYDSVNKTVRQAVTLAEGSFDALLPRTSKAAGATVA